MSKIEEKTEITVIMPIFKLDEELFKNALTSIASQLVQPDEVLFVVAKGSDDLKLVKKLTKNEKRFNFKIQTHDGNTSVQAQMNFGVSKCKTKWFSYLEQDDEFSKIWIKNAVEYKEVYGDVGIFLPLVLDVTENNEVIGISNEAVWAAEFSEEMGVLDINSSLKHPNFNFDGMVMLKEVYEDFGGMKENIELTFMYEFFLRMMDKSIKIMVVPKIGYKHINMREGGLFHSLKDKLSQDEARWWLATAKREYYHTNDRELEYTKL